MNLEELKNAWVEAGNKVGDLNAQLNAALVDDTKTEEDVLALKNQVTTARAKRDVLKEQVTTMEAEQVANLENGNKILDNNEKELKDKFIGDFKAMMQNNPTIVNELNSSTDEGGNAIGLTIPSDVRTTINTLVRQFNSLQEYVTVESVSTSNGSRVIEKISDLTPLKDLDNESEEIPSNDDPKLSLVKYLIKRYAGINTVTNSLLKDTAENILAWLTGWISKKVVVTRNVAILKTLEGVKHKQDVKTMDDIKDVTNVTLDPAISDMSMILTNQSGYNALDKVKKSDGSYALQKDVSSATVFTFLGLPITRISDRFLPNTGEKFPLYVGSLSEAVTLFDREQMSILSTNVGGGAFETDTTKVRVIDRFDTQLKDDEAVALLTFTAIADEVPVKPGE